MRRVVLDMRNYLFADAIAQALKSADSDFDVHRSERPEKTAELCSLCDPYALLMEVTGYTPWKLEERLRIRDEVKRRNSHCKIALIVDENAEKKLARQVLQAKKDGLMTGTRKDGVIEVQYGDLHMFFVKEGMPVPDYAKHEANQETTEETESEPETTAAPVETEPVTSGVADGPYAWWSGDWYGWWVIRNGGGQFEDWVDSWWDACATIEVYDDSTGFIFLWDDSNEAGEGFCYADDWFDYYIILRPWGTEWEDIRNADTTNLPYDDMMPLSYDSWYLPLIRSGVTKAPESFGETEPGAPVMTWRIRSVPSRSDKAKKEAA